MTSRNDKLAQGFLAMFASADPNTRIAAAERSTWWADRHPQFRRRIQGLLLEMLKDETCDDYEYAGFQCSEDEEAIEVCDAAAQALVRMRYARDVRRVAEKARRAGYPAAQSLERDQPTDVKRRQENASRNWSM